PLNGEGSFAMRSTKDRNWQKKHSLTSRPRQDRHRTRLELEELEPRVVPTMITIDALKDNTLFSDSPTGSDGAGPTFFVGPIISGAIRRGVIAFDVTAPGNVPAGATINSVSLRLNMDRTRSGAQTVELHRLTADWGEGTSTGGGPGGGQPGAATTND